MAGLLSRLAVPIIMLVFIIGYWLSIRDMALFARGFPLLIIVLLGVAVLATLVLEMRDWQASRKPAAAPGPVEAQERDGAAGGWSVSGAMHGLSQGWGRTVTMLLLALLLARGIQTVGFYTSIIVFLIVGLVILGVRSWSRLIAIVGGSGVMIYFLFEVLLQLRLPGPTPLP